MAGTDQGSKLIPSLVQPTNPNPTNPQMWQDPNNGGKPTSGDQVRIGAYYIQALLTEPVKDFSIVTTGKNYVIPPNSGNQIVQIKVHPIISDANLTNQGLDQHGAKNAGNFGGDTRDIDVLTQNMPTIPEDGGNVNRTATMKDSLFATTVDMGIYMQQTFKTINVDPDNKNNQLQYAFDREFFIAIVELHAKSLLIDLLLSAATVRYAGIATNIATITGEGATPSVISYQLLKQVSSALFNKKAKMQTKMVVGVALTDTVTIPACYIAYAPDEIINLLEDLKDNLGRPAWDPVEKYASGAGSTYANEAGRIGNFRIVRKNWMPAYYGKGAEEVNNEMGAATTTDSSSVSRYNAYPMLVVTEDTFGQVSILYDAIKGRKVEEGGCKITVLQSEFGKVTVHDPYGRTMIKSAQWVYGFLAIYPERNAVIWSAGVL